jgi:transposase
MARAAGSSGREQYWRQVVAQWRRSGLTVRGFCLGRGLSETLFYWWRRELARRDGAKVERRDGSKVERRDASKVQFFPVRLTHREAESRTDAGIDIVLANGRCLRVRPGFDQNTLVEVVHLLDEGGASC